MKLADFLFVHQADSLTALAGRHTWTTDITLRQFAGLRDILRNPDGVLTVTSTCVAMENADVACRLELSGTMVLDCQRCLEQMNFAVAISQKLVFTADAQRQQDSEAEHIMFSEYDGIATVIEHELLLALPMMPKHPLNECPARHMLAESSVVEQQKKHSAFRALDTLHLQ